MRSPFELSLLLVVPCLLLSCHGIIIDPKSCAKYGDMLVEAFALAFDHAAKGATALNNPSASQQELAHAMFGPQSNWNEAKTRLGNIHNLPSAIGHDINDRSNAAEIVVFCDLERLEKSDRKDGAWYDPFSKAYDAPKDKTFDDIEMCKTGKSVNGKPRPKAITNNYPHMDLREKPTPVTMDLCNWYLEEVKAREWPTVKDVPSPQDDDKYKNFWSKLSQGIKKVGEELVNQFFKTQMDMSALLDQLVLHEMCHSAVSGTPQARLGETEAYGWDACVDASSPTNAESLAFFGLGCHFIEQGYTISQAGAIQSPPSTPGKRRKRRRNSFVAMLGVASTVGGAIL